jgi:hypothetical protein
MRNLAHLTARFFGAPLLIEPSAGANLANAFMAVMGGEQPTLPHPGAHHV